MRFVVQLTIAILTSCGGHLQAREAKTRDSEITEKSPLSGQRPEPEAAVEDPKKERTAERCIMYDPVQWAAQEVIWRRETHWNAFQKAIREVRERRLQKRYNEFLQRHRDMRELRKLPRAEFLAAMKKRSSELSMNSTPYFLVAP